MAGMRLVSAAVLLFLATCAADDFNTLDAPENLVMSDDRSYINTGIFAPKAINRRPWIPQSFFQFDKIAGSEQCKKHLSTINSHGYIS